MDQGRQGDGHLAVLHLIPISGMPFGKKGKVPLPERGHIFLPCDRTVQWRIIFYAADKTHSKFDVTGVCKREQTRTTKGKRSGNDVMSRQEAQGLARSRALCA
jgi:hypothetical protein